MPASTEPSLTRTAPWVALMTLLSRLTGLLQTRLVSAFLGVGPIADAFNVAYRLPNLLRRFTAEGTLTSAFLPTLAQAETEGGLVEGRDLAARFLGTAGMLMALVCAGVMLLMGGVMGVQMIGRLLEPGAPVVAQLHALIECLAGQRPFPEEVGLAVDLARLMFPYLALVTLTAGIAAVLNLRGRFVLPAAVSIFYNLAFVGFGWACLRLDGSSATQMSRRAFGFALATLVGGLVQLLALWIPFRRLGYRIAWGFHFAHPGVRQVLRRMAPGLLGAGIAPVNVFLSTLLASQLAPGAQTVLFNANMMGEFALGLFSTSLATVSLPAMAKQVSVHDLDGMRGTLHAALRGTGFFMLPAAVGLGVLALPICALIFHTGLYDASAVQWTASTLQLQVVGLPCIAANRILAQGFYALQDYRTPALAALGMVAANLGATGVLMHPLGTPGIGLANSLAAALGLLFLLGRLKAQLPHPPFGPVLRGWMTFALASAVMGVCVAWLSHSADIPSFQGTWPLAPRLFGLILVGALAYGGMLLLLGNPEAHRIWQRMRDALPMGR